jgi:hypothetical protein
MQSNVDRVLNAYLDKEDQVLRPDDSDYRFLAS